VLEAEEAEENSGRPESDQDLKPFMNRSKARVCFVSLAVPQPLTACQGGNAEEEEEEEDDGHDGEVRAWTLRKSSASSLDVLSNCFSEDLLPVLLPIVDVRPPVPGTLRARHSDPCPPQARLRESDWRLRESAILALGAVAEGCDAGLSHLGPQIIQGLLPMLDDPRPLV
jgi:transportin-1